MQERIMTGTAVRILAILLAVAVLTPRVTGAPASARAQEIPQTPAPPTTPQTLTPEVVVETTQTFDEWLAALVQEARDRGFEDELVQEALVGLEPLPRVIQSDRNQAELNPGFDRYLAARATPTMIRQGRTQA